MKKQIIAVVLGLAFSAAASAIETPNWFQIGVKDDGRGLWVDMANPKTIENYMGWHFWIRIVDAKTTAAAKAVWNTKDEEQKRSDAVNRLIEASGAESQELFLDCEDDTFHVGKADFASIIPGSGLAEFETAVCEELRKAQTKKDSGII